MSCHEQAVTTDVLQDAADAARADLREQFHWETNVDPLTGDNTLPDPVTPYAADPPDSVRPQLMGYCYQNARAMSGQLFDRGIPHTPYYLGITMDVVQFMDDVSQTDVREAKESGNTESLIRRLPQTREEIFDEANHYAILVDAGEHDHLDGDGYWVVEPFSELRDHYGDSYMGPLPVGYIRPEDGAVEPWERDPDWHWNTNTLETYPESYYDG